MRISIIGGRLIDPASGTDGQLDLHLNEGRVAAVGTVAGGFQPERTIDARGLVVCPGLIDLCARLREPGQEHKATIASETRAAVAGGITTVCVPPDTNPVIDDPSVVEYIRRRNNAAGQCRVVVTGALTRDLGGESLSEMGALKDAGCVGVSNALIPVANTLVMRRAMEYAATYDLKVFLHACDPWLSAGGCAHEGAVATRLGLPGIPASAETVIIGRDLALIEEVGVRAHFCRLSTRRGAEMVAEARERGLAVSADVSAHQLHLDERFLANFDSLCHLSPPLRTEADMLGLRQAVKEGLVEAICSDHQPHEEDAKEHPFGETEPGISSLETLLPLSLLLAGEDMPTATVLARLTEGPARVLSLEAGKIGPGAPADICVFDPRAKERYDSKANVSRGKHSPFSGREFPCRVTHTLVEGRLVYEAATALGRSAA